MEKRFGVYFSVLTFYLDMDGYSFHTPDDPLLAGMECYSKVQLELGPVQYNFMHQLFSTKGRRSVARPGHEQQSNISGRHPLVIMSPLLSPYGWLRKLQAMKMLRKWPRLSLSSAK